MRVAFVLAFVALLAGCGADGAPKPPASQPGVAITGQVKVGVVGGT